MLKKRGMEIVLVRVSLDIVPGNNSEEGDTSACIRRHQAFALASGQYL